MGVRAVVLNVHALVVSRELVIRILHMMVVLPLVIALKLGAREHFPRRRESSVMPRILVKLLLKLLVLILILLNWSGVILHRLPPLIEHEV